MLALLLVLGMAGTAVGGTGIGAVFNLGRTNAVNYLSSLVGSYSKILQITNNSTSTSSVVLGLRTLYGTPLQLVGSTAKPPLTTNSSVRVPRLNADLVDGYDANQLVRVAQGTHPSGMLLTGSPTVLDSVTITAPKAGYVLVSSTIEFDYNGAGSGDCPCNVQFYLQEGAATGQLQFATVPKSTPGNIVTGTQWLFPVTAGTHTFNTMVDLFYGGGSVSAGLATVTAVYVPFNGAGG